MTKNPNRDTPKVHLGTLTYSYELLGEQLFKSVRVGSSDWFTWLESAEHFHLDEHAGRMTCRNERRRGKLGYWYGARKVAGRTVKVYLGKADKLTIAHLRAKARDLATR